MNLCPTCGTDVPVCGEAGCSMAAHRDREHPKPVDELQAFLAEIHRSGNVDAMVANLSVEKKERLTTLLKQRIKQRMRTVKYE